MRNVISEYYAIAARGGNAWERGGRMRLFLSELTLEERDEVRREVAKRISEKMLERV